MNCLLRGLSSFRSARRSVRNLVNEVHGTRNSSSIGRKRFYKKVGIVHNDGAYEITLDNRKLKTPQGNVFKLSNEILALMVLTEWDAQTDEILPNTMHLNALCNTALENPNKVVKEDAVEKLLVFLESDTILYYSQSEEVNALQKREWDPIIEWFNERYELDIAGSLDLTGSVISEKAKAVMRKQLLSYDMLAIHGFNLAVESLKSLILTLACLERQIMSKDAVRLSRLEEEYQAGRWGRVEWSHDMSQLDIQARFTAGILFIRLNSMSDEAKAKLGMK